MSKPWREYKARIRKLALENLGGKCVSCGISDFRVLQIDHINGGGRAELRINPHSSAQRAAKGNLEGLQLLCANCNWIKRYDRNEGNSRKG